MHAERIFNSVTHHNCLAQCCHWLILWYEFRERLHCSYIYRGKPGVQESIPWQSFYSKHSTSIDKTGRKSLNVNNPVFSHTVQSHYSLRGFTVCMYIWLFYIQSVGQISVMSWVDVQTKRVSSTSALYTLNQDTMPPATVAVRCSLHKHTPQCQEKTIKCPAVCSRIDVTLCPRAILQR